MGDKKMKPPGQIHDFSSTQIQLPHEIAQHVIAFGKSIPDKHLAKEEATNYGGSSSWDGRESDVHSTLKYGIHSGDPKAVVAALKGEPPIKVKLGKTSLFKNPEHDVLKIEVHSPDMHRLNKKVAESGPVTDTHPTYRPHITIGYLKPGHGDKYDGLSKFEGMEATIPHVTFSSKDGTKTQIPLNQMPKTMTFQRRANRAARKAVPDGPGDFGGIPAGIIPHEAITDAPDPMATDAIAAGGLPVARGNSNQQSMTPEGHATVQKTGSDLATLGGMDQIIASPAERTMETAADVQAADPKKPPVSTNPGLESQAYGKLEGEAKSPEVRKFLAKLVREHPDYRIPGQGAMSSRQGESFNEFRVRALSAIRGIMQSLAQNPHQSIAVPKHTQVSKLVKGWIAKGMPDDLSVSHEAFLKDEDPAPGEVEKFAPEQDGSWSMNKFDPEKEKALPKGAIYFIEHGQTPATAAKSGNVSASQKARAELIMAIRGADWKAAKSVAMKAASAGILSDPEIEQIIDEALPSMEEIAKMQPHQLLPVASAAGPEKRLQMLPILKEKMGEFSGASPQAVNALKTHLGRLAAVPKAATV